MLVSATILSIASITSASADQKTIKTVQDLYEACKSASNSVPLLICITYIQWVEDMMQLTGMVANDPHVSAQETRDIGPFAACNLPNTEQIRQAFISWADRSPNYRQSPSGMGVWQTISQKWSCPSKVLPQLPSP
ncbi:MAG TPA: Rap1a/Tai family immunity protein [Micropepsaceae bacterium]|nr:Rap1a/Tai family immunity protein [Micropepsaceae bacterium]